MHVPEVGADISDRRRLCQPPRR